MGLQQHHQVVEEQPFQALAVRIATGDIAEARSSFWVVIRAGVISTEVGIMSSDSREPVRGFSLESLKTMTLTQLKA